MQNNKDKARHVETSSEYKTTRSRPAVRSASPTTTLIPDHKSYSITSCNMPLPNNPDQSKTEVKSSATAQTAHEVEKPSSQSVASASHVQKTEAELQAERLYEERMEDEYAKREGGA
ncbi:hypothetical protein K504DRAFT_503111 [Pleomassaria siparia CBS 279.74]|uniref:Uncharacterized protein n=1 Tax=Pleomassaria siparia CBS 279.74 TaxID=1314801 RepID=A0A6G1K9K1_9PLEO|nr:hypothetical protein K504DRAFT_503111 [Pleomassaria siparia CBS 279.74]